MLKLKAVLKDLSNRNQEKMLLLLYTKSGEDK